MRVTRFCGLIAICLIGPEVAQAQTLDSEMLGLSGRLCKTLAAQGYKNVAAVDFTDLQSQPTELGRFLSERLAVEIVSTGGVSMVDRANIKSILAEHKLTEEGLVNPANAKKLGEFAGVDAILIGNVTGLDDAIELMVKVISTASAKIVAAGRIRFPKTSDLQAILNRSISATSTTQTTTGSSVGAAVIPSYREANTIATRDVGPLRVVLKGIMPITAPGTYGVKKGIRCSFDFVSRETQRPLLVGLNARQERGYNRGDCKLGRVLRSILVDSNGVTYSLANAEASGVSVIGVGCDDMVGYDPSQIANLLATQDRTGNRGQEKGEYVYGSLSTIKPGESVSVTMNFVPDSEPHEKTPARPQYCQVSTELVVGVGAADVKERYSLQNVTFDRVSIP